MGSHFGSSTVECRGRNGSNSDLWFLGFKSLYRDYVLPLCFSTGPYWFDGQGVLHLIGLHTSMRKTSP
uniref:Uncharacterized protein n=1 Tax=Anguilla anguilla TaxID=7936 RepID=A0A0E9X543_ANGAN